MKIKPEDYSFDEVLIGTLREATNQGDLLLKTAERARMKVVEDG